MSSQLGQGHLARARSFDSESVLEVSGPYEGPGVLVLGFAR